MKKSLKSIASIRSGYQFRGRVEGDASGNVAVIQIKDIEHDARWATDPESPPQPKIRLDDLACVQLDRFEPHLLARGDVLFLSRGHRLYAAALDEPAKCTIATGFFFVLSPNPRLVLPDFLAWSLNQPGFQESVRPLLRGSHIPLISKSDFEGLTIHVPSLTIQTQLLELQRLSDRERELLVAIQQKRSHLTQLIASHLLTGRILAKDRDNAT